MTSLETYRRRFTRLNINRQNGGAPHKPILLLAVIDLYERGLINGNQFPFSDLLIDTFYSIWKDLVPPGSVFSPTIVNPVWRLRSDKFWRSIPLPGKKFIMDGKKNVRSFRHYRETVSHIEIDMQLALLLSEPVTRAQLQHDLLEKYFPNQAQTFLQDQLDDRWKRYDDRILMEPEGEWIPPEKQTRHLDRTEEKYVRDLNFSKKIMRAYENTCCVSHLRVDYPGKSLVDACHIIPHGDTGDNRIRNGIALTPTLHRAFDDFAFTIDRQSFQVRLSQRIRENERSPYRLNQFEGKPIRLPSNSDYYPGKEHLAWHNEQFHRRQA